MSIFKRIFGQINKESSKNDTEPKGKSRSVTLDILRDNLFPIIKNENDPIFKEWSKADDPILYDSFVEGLVVVYNIDFNDQFMIVPNSLLDHFKLKKEQIVKQAYANLYKRVGNSVRIHNINPNKMMKYPPKDMPVMKEFKKITIGNSLDASIMLYNNMWPQFTELIKDKKIGACIPAKNILFISTFSDDKIAFNSMRALTNQMYEVSKEEDIAISKNAYVWEGGKWKKYLDEV